MANDKVSEDELSIKPIEEALYDVSRELTNNNGIADEIIAIILNYIFHPSIIQSGMVFFGRVTQGDDWEYNLVFLITEIKNIKIHETISYFYQSFDFDAIFIWPLLDDSVSIGSGKMTLIENGLLNTYKIFAIEQEYHKQTIGKDLIHPCEYNMTLKLPDYDEECEWNDWNGYLNRIKLSGQWQDPLNADPESGDVHCYRVKKWNQQIDGRQYVEIEELKKLPCIKSQTTIKDGVHAIEQIIQNVTLNGIDDKNI